MPSAAARSSPTRSSIAVVDGRSPACAISRSGCSACDPLGHRRQRRPGRSWSLASWTASSSADRSGFHCGSDDLRPRRRRPRCRAGARRRPRRGRGRVEVAASAVISTFSVCGASRPASCDHRVGAAGLADPVVGVGGLDWSARRRPARPRRRPTRARRAIARQGWVALQRAARSGMPVNGLRTDMAVAPRVWSERLGHLQPADRSGSRSGVAGPGPGWCQHHYRARPRIGEDGAMTTSRRHRRPTRPAAPDGVRRRAAGARRAGLIVLFVLVVPSAACCRRRGRVGLLLLARARRAGGSPTSTGRWPAGSSAPPLPPPYRPDRRRAALGAAAASAGPRDPMTWRDLAWLLAALTVGLRARRCSSCSCCSARRHRVRSGGSASSRSCGPAAAMDRWFLSHGHTEVLEQRVQVLTETRAEARRPLRRRAAPDRARPARRRAGPAGRARR